MLVSDIKYQPDKPITDDIKVILLEARIDELEFHLKNQKWLTDLADKRHASAQREVCKLTFRVNEIHRILNEKINLEHPDYE